MELIDNGGDCGTEEALESVSLLNLSFSLKWLAFTWKATSSEISQFLAHYNCQSVLWPYSWLYLLGIIYLIYS